MSFKEYDNYDALGLAELVKNKEVSAEELLEEAIQRTEKVDDQINAVVLKHYDEAKAMIKDGLPDGPFTGVPYLLKDLHVLLTGTKTTYGSEFFKDYVADHNSTLVDRYLEAGFATVTLHSFSSRNVSSTVGEQVSATTAMLVHDSYKVLEILSNDKRLDADNIGITGWSLGGGVSFFTAWKPIKDVISPNYSFAAHLPIYPPCMVMPDNLSFTNSPIHILIGEKRLKVLEILVFQ